MKNSKEGTLDEQKKLDKSIDYLKQKYHPIDAVIIHGSRASGHAKEHSDWDFIVLAEHEVEQKQYRDNILGQEIEFEVFQLPIHKDEILKKFNTKLKYAKAVYDENGNAQKLIDQAQSIYSEEIPSDWITSERLVSQKSYLQSAIDGMKDNVDNPAMFMKKLGLFYPRVINIWYHVKEKSYPDNIYLSIPYIKEKDPEFHRLLEVFYSLETTPAQKIEVSEKMVNIMFQE